MKWLASTAVKLDGFSLKNRSFEAILYTYASYFLDGNFFLEGLFPPSNTKNLLPNRSPLTLATILPEFAQNI